MLTVCKVLLIKLNIKNMNFGGLIDSLEFPFNFDGDMILLDKEIEKIFNNIEITKHFKKHTKLIVKINGKCYCIFRTGHPFDNCSKNNKKLTAKFTILCNGRERVIDTSFPTKEAMYQYGKTLLSSNKTIADIVMDYAKQINMDYIETFNELQNSKIITINFKNKKLISTEFIEKILEHIKDNIESERGLLILFSETTSKLDQHFSNLFDELRRHGNIPIVTGILAPAGRCHKLGIDIPFWNKIRFEWMVKVILCWCDQFEINPIDFTNCTETYFEVANDKITKFCGNIMINHFLEKQLSVTFLNEWMFTSIDSNGKEGGKNYLGLIWDFILFASKTIGRAPTFSEFSKIFDCELKFIL
jgi:hypothetical protein